MWHTEFMSRRLKETVEQYLTKKGSAVGKAELCAAVGKGEATLRRWIKDGVPTSHDAYALALACGCTEDEALLIAKEESQEAS